MPIADGADARDAPQNARGGATLADPIPIAKLWKSPRDRRQTIVLAIKQYEGHTFLDCRLHDTNQDGQTVPTKKGLTVGMPKLQEFAAAVAKALATARELGLIDDEGGER
jgi:hypothetical protein